LERSIQLPDDSFPCGVVVDSKEKRAFVCLSKKNQLAIVNLGSQDDDVQQDEANDEKDGVEANPITTIPVGVAPFDVLVDETSGKAWVSNIGGRLPKESDSTASSANSDVVVDKRGIASTGSVSVVDLKETKLVREISVGLHPSVMCWGSNQKSVLVCNTNADVVTQIIASTFESSEINVKPDVKLPFGSMPSAVLCLPGNRAGIDTNMSGAGQVLVALAGNNALGVLGRDGKSLSGLIPTGWYPAAIAANAKYVFVANVKGEGSRANVRPKEKGRNSHDHLGTIQRIDRAKLGDANQLSSWTKLVKKNGRFPQILRSQELRNRGGHSEVKPVPIPAKLGEPSVFKHVIYVIKENRTFDQVFGDIKEARGEPDLCVFPEKVTPNHHALARRFGILDNYYCNGVLSADGHSWATEGNVTPYLERAFGGFARSYTFGDDPITYSSSGFIWDHILSAGLSFRNFGEFDYAQPPEGMKYQEIWKAYSEGKPIQFKQKIGIERLRNYTCPDYPGWNMVIPDVVRMERFIKEFREFEKNDGLPNLCLVYLPQDHLGGGVTSNAHMADNDLALGRLVEAVSGSKYWKDTVIFVNEDDPQNGFDHIDGHRSLCLAISAYSRRGINHSFYNQTSVLRTMLHIFGLPPMNQQDASMPLMTKCFQNQPNLAPYKALPANFALNETPKPKKEQSAAEQRWRSILATVPIQRTGMKTEKDEDNLNRFVWHDTRGWQTPYPEEWAGAHGRGLEKLGLKIDRNVEKD